MTKQLSLPGLAPTVPLTDRLFLGIFPDPVTAARIRDLAIDLRARHALQGTPLATERFHVTLQLVGDYAGLPKDVVARVHEVAATVASPVFDVTFDRVASFGGRPRKLPFVLQGGDGLTALRAFQRTVYEALKTVALVRRAEPNFTPHVTLLYDDRNLPEQPVEPICWKATEFVLIHSLLGQTRHIPIGRWPLRG